MHLRLTNVSEPEFFAVAWPGAAGTRLRLVNRRGTTETEFQLQHSTGGQWQPIPATRKVHLDRPPATFEELEDIVRGILT